VGESTCDLGRDHITYGAIFSRDKYSITLIGGRVGGGPSPVTPSRGIHDLKKFVAEFRKNTG